MCQFITNNNLQIDGTIEDVMNPYPIDQKFKSFGFEIINIDGHDIDEIIIKALSIKKYVVENDPKEKGMRKILNFGHTIGHAIESNSNYLHGECVGMGMLYLSSDEVKVKLEKILGKYSLPNKTNIDSLTLYKFITLDKKRSGDYLSIIYVDKIGTCEIKKILLTDIKKYL